MFSAEPPYNSYVNAFMRGLICQTNDVQRSNTALKIFKSSECILSLDRQTTSEIIANKVCY